MNTTNAKYITNVRMGKFLMRFSFGRRV